MFKLIKIFISAGLAVLLILVVLYFLPTNIKIKGLQAITGVVPDKIKGEVESFILTPPEKRDKILRELQVSLDNIASLETSDMEPMEILKEVNKEILNTRKFTRQLEDINNDVSLTSMLTSKLVDKFIGSSNDTNNSSINASTSNACNCELKKEN